jgi:26S proteasome regulatory subunit N1
VDAARVSLHLGYDSADIESILSAAHESNPLVAKQICLLLARARAPHETEVGEDLDDVISNESLSDTYLALGRDLDVVDAKTPEDIYKSHLSETAGFKRGARAKATVDSARANLASTFVNAFVNAGFGHDTLLTPPDADWLYKNKAAGMMSATASLGMIMLWNVESGLTVIDK